MSMPQPDLANTPFGSDDPDWYKDAIIYEVHVRAFCDSNADGIGDFRGLTSRLDYLRDLGITAIWLLPFSPSPLRDDGYDIANYTDINPMYGTLDDFKEFIAAAHARGLKVITELVINHTSDQHPWFQRARHAPPNSPERDFYVWSDTPDRYSDARIIFTDTERSNWTWDPVANAYYWHRFFSHQPDLNFDNPQVQTAVLGLLEFWFDLGVDGLRLDAVPYLYEREGTNCENLPETHAFLKRLRAHIDARYENRMLLAEANQWPEDAVAYFGNGDECHMSFHFPLMPRLFMAVHMEDSFPIIDILRQTPPIPDGCQWALFLRNHDELTLEMVTDEDRDYMYRIYAQDPQARINVGIRRRLAPLLGNNRRRIELLNGLLFSMPGSPVLYYGDEIGMGDNFYLADRNAVRTPMQWSSDRNAGFSQANPQKLYLPIIIDPEYHYETVNVEAQQNNPYSLLWWMKRMIRMRKRHRAFGRGSISFLNPDNRKVLAFLREYEDETILIVANLSRFTQAVELDLSDYKNLTPIEMFGHTPFPAIGDLPYFLTLGPHSFYWFLLEPRRTERDPDAPEGGTLPLITVAGSWEQVLHDKPRAMLEAALPAYLQSRRWFGGKARTIQHIELTDTIRMSHDDLTSYLLLVRVAYTSGDPQTYALPVTYASGEAAERVLSDLPDVVIARMHVNPNGTAGTADTAGTATVGVLYDALYERSFSLLPLTAIATRRMFPAQSGSIVAEPGPQFRALLGNDTTSSLSPSLLGVEQSNTSIVYGDRFVLKLLRRVEEGISPEVEMGRFLTERQHFAHTPQLAGTIEYRPQRGAPAVLAVLQQFVPNQGDAWRYTLDELGAYFDRVLTLPPGTPPPDVPATLRATLRAHAAQATAIPDYTPDVATPAQVYIGHYLEMARLLGQRTGELHLALAADRHDPAFAPEPHTPQTQRSLYQSMRTQITLVLQMLRKATPRLSGELQAEAHWLLQHEDQLLEYLQGVLQTRITAARIRCHGDYHLGQVLFTGNDFLIIDFEGEPSRSLADRRRKRLAMQDVAGMLRSFHYAAYTALSEAVARGALPDDQQAAHAPWAHFWYRHVAAVFLQAYLDACGNAPFVPRSEAEQDLLLTTFVLDKAIYEVGYELNNRPHWLYLPMLAVRHILTSQEYSAPDGPAAAPEQADVETHGDLQ